MKCRLCGAESPRLGGRADVTLHRCPRCWFVSGSPAAPASPEEYYEDYYSGPPPPAPEARYQEWLGRAEAEVGTGRLLEVGAGSGGFVQVAVRRGWRVDATELSRSGLRLLEGLGARVFAGPVEDAGYPAGVFDMVASLEVLEHVPQPLEHLRELFRVTRPGGLLLLTTPNFGGLTRRRLGFSWRVVDPEHLGYFEPRTLERALKEAGYRRIRVRARSLDLSSWRRPRQPGAVQKFDPQASAQIRDGIQASPGLRIARDLLNLGLGWTNLGDSLLAWCQA